MGDKISLHFKRSEFACKCGCGYDTVDAELLRVAEMIRQEIGAFTPTSACRCSLHNKYVKGAIRSKHLIGRAMDVAYRNPDRLYKFLDMIYPSKYGIGKYVWGVHIDTRNDKARWDNSI